MPDIISPTNRSRIAFVSVSLLLFAFSFGYLLHATYVAYRPSLELPQWQGALPITADKGMAIVYFRREFSIPSAPSKAYLVLSGTDDLSVYVNGDLAGKSRYFGAKTSEIMDITRFVHRGNNLLAVAVDSNAPDAVSELTARLELLLPDGSRKTLLTNPEWRATGVEDYSPSRHEAWYAPDFVDLHWSPAQVNDPPDDRPVHPYRVPEWIFQTFPDGYWIAPQSGDQHHATFVRDFQLNEKRITGAWLGVSMAGNYTITLNDQFLYSYAGTPSGMELFDLGPYVKPGGNRLYIQVDSARSLLKLAVSGVVSSAAGSVDFSSDGRWRTLTTEGAEQAGSATGPVMVMQRLGQALNDSHVTLNYREIDTPIEMRLDSGMWFGVLSLMLLIASSSSLGLLHLFMRRLDPLPFSQDLENLSYTFLFGALLALGLVIFSYDIRVDAKLLFQPYALVTIGLQMLLLEGFVILERINRRRTIDG